jgi:O-antigen ligase
MPVFVIALLALAAPALLTLTRSPTTTAFNQIMAVGCWGLLLAYLPAGPRATAATAVRAPLALLGLLVLCVLWSWSQALPSSLAMSALAMMVCAAVVLVAAQADPDDAEGPLLRPVLAGMVLAGVLSSLVALVQVFFPSWADGDFIAVSGLAGRAVGNLRQPNHLSTILVWGVMALVPLAQQGRIGPLRLPRWLSLILGALMVVAVVLTASRTGMVAMFLLFGWGLLDRRLPRWLRIALALAPVVYLAGWMVSAGWAHETAHAFGGEARLAERDLSSSRFAIWKNTLSLIAANPWTGVGWGEFNFAWTLSPFPDRPVAFFDHTHNLFLQFAVELGIPMTIVLAVLLVAAVVLAFQRSLRHEGDAGIGSRAALVIMLMAGLHSMLEYPLWYAYFLLPAAWALGHALRPVPSAAPGAAMDAQTASEPSQKDDAEEEGAASAVARWAVPVAGMLMAAGAVFAVSDYQHVVVIYEPGDTTLSLEQRINTGRHSIFYGHQADYAAATTTEPPSQALGSFDVTTHALLDTRLMMAWARALDESGHHDEARYLAERIREFHNPASDDFLAVCNTPGIQPVPFQCEAPKRRLTWRDFLPRR